MEIIRKDASITNTDEVSPGSFEVILSSPTLDRDGETLAADGWKMPLPEHITFDVDHGMNVASTVGSGVPRLDDAGNLVVTGTYSSLPRAQEVRTLVNEGHIRTTSVAFMVSKTRKDGKETSVRELLNGAFVAIPSNREALVLASKGVKVGARNSAGDMGQIQAIHDATSALGAACAAPAKAAGSRRPLRSAKEAMAAMAPMPAADPAAAPVADPEVTADPMVLAQSVDAALDEAATLLEGVDLTTFPAEVQQAIALVLVAAAACGELLDAMGAPDPDEDNATEPAPVPAAAPAKAAAPAETAAAEADALTLTARSLAAFAAGYTLSD